MTGRRVIVSYITLALRHLAKYRLYALINVVGLALGLSVFLFGSIMVRYEYNHDNMFTQRDRIYTVGSLFSAKAGEPISEFGSARLAYGPLFDKEIEAAQLVARTVLRERVLSVGDVHIDQMIRFVDSDFTGIFDFHYLYGNDSLVDGSSGLIVTASTARKLFGRIDVLGRTVTLNHQFEMYISAVIEDVAPDSHFNSSLLPNSTLTAIAPLTALVAIGDFDMEGQWQTLHAGDFTYVLLPSNLDRHWLQKQVNAVSARHIPAKEYDYIKALNVRPLVEVNTQVWEAMGFPLIEAVQLLGLLILLIASVNYTNLATAQNFDRTREVGLRKTFGAQTPQLLTQFLVESITLATFAMLLALACIELIIPAYNDWTGKAMRLVYADILPWLFASTVVMGLLAGLYPAYMIARHNPLDSLQNRLLKGRKGAALRSFMIAVQFAISIFILAMVMIIAFQNDKVRALAEQFPKSEIVVLSGLSPVDIVQKQPLLRQRLQALPGVKAVTFSNGIPFRWAGDTRKVTADLSDESPTIKLYLASVDADFMKAFDIKLVTGRLLDTAVTNDIFDSEVEQLNVVVNQLTAQKLGFGRGDEAIGKTFYNVMEQDDPQARLYTIVGLMPDQYFLGVHTTLSPLAFYISPQNWQYASLRVNEDDLPNTLRDIDAVWSSVIENYPVSRSMLDEYFRLFFRIPLMINDVFTLFAVVALSLALTGLFGLAAFMAQRRSKEIALRKLMGASVGQIVQLLIWQFSQPIMWSLLVAMPMAYLASGIYLNFFAEQINFVIPVIIMASVLAILSAWLIVASHALYVASATPIRSLRHK